MRSTAGGLKASPTARGSIRFVIESTGAAYDLSPGDRLEIPPHTAHSAVVGPEGVECVEAARV